MSANNRERLNELLIMYRKLTAEIAAIKEQLKLIENARLGFAITEQTIKELREAEPGHEMIVPIGNGAFTKVKLIDPNLYLISIGKDVLVERNADESLEFARKVSEELRSNGEVLTQRLNTLNGELEKIMAEMDKMGVFSGAVGGQSR